MQGVSFIKIQRPSSMHAHEKLTLARLQPTLVTPAKRECGGVLLQPILWVVGPGMTLESPDDDI